MQLPRTDIGGVFAPYGRGLSYVSGSSNPCAAEARRRRPTCSHGEWPTLASDQAGLVGKALAGVFCIEASSPRSTRTTSCRCGGTHRTRWGSSRQAVGDIISSFGALMHNDPLLLLSTGRWGRRFCLVFSADAGAAQMLVFRFAVCCCSFWLPRYPPMTWRFVQLRQYTAGVFRSAICWRLPGCLAFSGGDARRAPRCSAAGACGSIRLPSELAAAVLVAVAIRRLAVASGRIRWTVLWAAVALLFLAGALHAGHARGLRGVRPRTQRLDEARPARSDPSVPRHTRLEPATRIRCCRWRTMSAGRYLPWPIVLCASGLFVAAAALTISAGIPAPGCCR